MCKIIFKPTVLNSFIYAHVCTQIIQLQGDLQTTPPKPCLRVKIHTTVDHSKKVSTCCSDWCQRYSTYMKGTASLCKIRVLVYSVHCCNLKESVPLTIFYQFSKIYVRVCNSASSLWFV